MGTTGAVDRSPQRRERLSFTTSGGPLIDFYVGLGRLAADSGELEQACKAYRRALQFCHLSNVASGGRWNQERKRISGEYASVLRGEAPSAT